MTTMTTPTTGTTGISDVTLDLSRESLTTVDVLTLSIKARVTGPMEPTFDPPISETLEASGWTVRNATPSPPELSSDSSGVVYAWSVRIEPFLAGEYTIPALTLRAGDAEASTSARTITVTPLMTDAEVAEASVEPLYAVPPPAPEPIVAPWLLIVTGTVLLIAVMAVILVVVRNLTRTTSPTVDPTASLDRADPSEQEIAIALRTLIARYGGLRERDAASLTVDDLRHKTSNREDLALAICDLERLDASRYGDSPLSDDDRRDIASRGREMRRNSLRLHREGSKR